MTIEELKRALVEVRERCEAAEDCFSCPFSQKWQRWDGRVLAGCPFQVTVDYEAGTPKDWSIDDWKEDANADKS